MFYVSDLATREDFSSSLRFSLNSAEHLQWYSVDQFKAAQQPHVYIDR